MRLKTILIDDRPVITLSVDVDLAVEDNWLHDPEFLTSMRQATRLRDILDAADPDLDEAVDQREIDEALNGGLGSDLQTLQTEGFPLWNGDHSRISVRAADDDEIAMWQRSYGQALSTEEAELGDKSWLVYLVPVSGGPRST